VYTERVQFGLGSGLTPVIKKLLIANFAIFLLQLHVFGLDKWIIDNLALQPNQVVHGKIWQLVTYMFLHSGFLHIIFNMFTLWMFGCEVEQYLGSKRFTTFYFLSGIGAALFHMLFNWNSADPMLGASGAIYGVLVAFAVLFPDRIITLLLFFVLPVRIKAKYLVGIFVGISVFLGLRGATSGSGDHIAHLAHLGGAVAGFVLLKYNVLLGNVIRQIKIRRALKEAKQVKKQNDDIQRKRFEVDRILDKINQVGYNQISDKEKKLLKEFSEILSRE
jgi:membrane associated rhomboid family serine protease